MPSLPVDGNLDFQGTGKPINLPTPVNPGDAVPKTYVDSVAQGIIYKVEVVATSTGANVSLTAPGSTLDGVTLANGNRILLKDQTTASQNGIYIWNGASSALTRSTDFATNSVQQPGTSVFVAGGATYSKAVFTMNTTGSVTVDTTSQTWVQSNGAADINVTAPLTLTGNTIAIPSPLPIANGGTNSTTASAARSALSATGKYAVSIGDGSTTTFTVTHGLGTTDVMVEVIDIATGNIELVPVGITGVNTISIGPFNTAPATASGSVPGGTGKRVVVIG